MGEQLHHASLIAQRSTRAFHHSVRLRPTSTLPRPRHPYCLPHHTTSCDSFKSRFTPHSQNSLSSRHLPSALLYSPLSSASQPHAIQPNLPTPKPATKTLPRNASFTSSSHHDITSTQGKSKLHCEFSCAVIEYNSRHEGEFHDHFSNLVFAPSRPYT